MSIKIKNFCFVGIAAAMLSATAANAAQTARTPGSASTVTSQKYTESKYEWLENKVDSTQTLNETILNSDDKYPSMKVMESELEKVVDALDDFTTNLDGDNVYTDVETVVDTPSLQPDDPGYATHKEVKVIAGNLVTDAAHVNDTGTDATSGVANGNKLVTASAVQQKTGANSKMVVGNSGGTWSSVASAVLENTNSYVDVVEDTSSGAVKLDIDSTKIKSYAGTSADTTLTSASQNLITEGVVKANLALKEDTANKLAYDETQGSETETISTNSGNNTKFPTVQNVYEFVTHQTGGEILPPMPPACGQTGNYCALVVTGTGTSGNESHILAWTVMANPS